MRSLLLIFLFGVSLMAFEHKLEFGIDGIAYKNYANEVLAEGSMDLAFENKLFNTNARVEFLYSSEYSDRRYILLNELYLSKEFDTYTLSIGKQIKYWGELEGYNLADIYNQKNYLKDPFDKSAKYGALGADIRRYFDENSLEFGVKFYEEDIEYPEDKTPYAPFSLSYNKKLELSDKRYTPTLYIEATFMSDAYFESETEIILLHGYDTKRDITLSSSASLSQYAYRVNKALFLSHILYADTIFKTEMSYTDVIEYESISDYTQLSFGIEKSFYEIAKSDITLFLEYYRYFYSDDSGAKNVDISEIYDDDIFLALRVSLNDTGSSEAKVGVLEDIKRDERIFKIEVNSRVMDSFVFNAEYLSIVSNATNTLLSKFNETSRFIVDIKYIF